MQDPELYVRQFQQEMSQKSRHKQPQQYPDDYRLHERPRVRKNEPPSQILSQQLLKSQKYAPDMIPNFTKPLINYAITSPKGAPQGRYNHNYLYLGQSHDNIFRKEPYNQAQKDYNVIQPQKEQRYSQSNDQRVNYQSVGNMLVSNQGDVPNQQFNVQPIESKQMTQPSQQQYYPQQQFYQAGSPNSYKWKGENYQPNNEYKFYGSRALKNLDSTQIY